MRALHKNLLGQVAVITGGGGVLCSHIALELARHGVKVAILNRTEEKGKMVVEEIIKRGGEAIAVAVDVLSRDSLEKALALIMEQFGKVNMLINGAGGNHPDAITASETYEGDRAARSFFHLQEEGFTQVLATNLTGTFLTSQVFGRELVKNDASIILNISSMSSYIPMTKVPAYSAAKAAINNLTMWMAVYFAGTGLRVNAIAPGFFLTTQNKNLLLNEDGTFTARSDKIISHTPMQKFGQPEDLLGTVLWLVDASYSGFVTGITVPVDGGFMAYSGV